MRLIKLLVHEDQQGAVLDLLDEENIDFVVTEDTRSSEDTSLIEFPLPTQAVEFVLGELRAAGVDDTEYTVIASAETAKTRNYHELEDRFVAGVEEDDSVAPEEIRAKALDMHRNALTYYSMTLLSAIVAAAGLLLNSPAVVVGAMVIAPQVGTALITSVGMVLDDQRMMRLGIRDQVLGFAAAIVAAIAFGFALRSGFFISPSLNVSTVGQISKRISPGLLSVSVAFCAGAAGAFGLATALPVSLVGVMIAAALIPAAAAVGIAWGVPSVYVGAFVLLVVNAIAVNLAGFAVLWYLDYRPADWTDDGVFESLSAYQTSAAIVVVLLVLFAGFGGLLVDQIAFDNEVNGGVEEVLSGEEYSELELREVGVELGLVSHFGQDPEVTVTVVRPDGAEYPGLATTLDEELEKRIGEDVVVLVEYRDRQRSEDPTGDGANDVSVGPPVALSAYR
ncbi:TIGR00341 family protein [Halomarina litorea]|uniref:TIGR00341 family protein n=1 Tax=Halomarina litorea TaxID=2961595 RepID=UPI0020C51FF0|nr:TIGR00341 family protein [Halomarina sp. BCD28]